MYKILLQLTSFIHHSLSVTCVIINSILLSCFHFHPSYPLSFGNHLLALYESVSVLLYSFILF